jgi:hypothetical protein
MTPTGRVADEFDLPAGLANRRAPRPYAMTQSKSLRFKLSVEPDGCFREPAYELCLAD